MHQHDCICLPGLYAYITTFQYHCQFFPNSSGRAGPTGAVASTVMPHTPIGLCTTFGLPFLVTTRYQYIHVYLRPQVGQVNVIPSVDTQVWVSINPRRKRFRMSSWLPV